MMSILQGLIDGNQFILLIIGLFIIGLFVYKEWPEFQKRVSKKAVDDKVEEVKDSDVAKDIASIKEDIKEIRTELASVMEKQSRDYGRLNMIEQETARQKKAINDSLGERKLLMRGIMACLDGLEQLNCNHTVPETKKAINDYLNDMAHGVEE